MEGLFAYDGPGHTREGHSGGSLAGNTHDSAPLAVRMRPRTLDELVGQEQLRAAGSPLRQLVEGDQAMSHPGVGPRPQRVGRIAPQPEDPELVGQQDRRDEDQAG